MLVTVTDVHLRGIPPNIKQQVCRRLLKKTKQKKTTSLVFGWKQVLSLKIRLIKLLKHTLNDVFNSLQ